MRAVLALVPVLVPVLVLLTQLGGPRTSLRRQLHVQWGREMAGGGRVRFVIMGEICMGPYNNYRRQASNAAKRQRVRAWEQTAAGAVVGAGKAAAAAALTPEEEVLSPLCCRTALALLPQRRRG